MHRAFRLTIDEDSLKPTDIAWKRMAPQSVMKQMPMM